MILKGYDRGMSESEYPKWEDEALEEWRKKIRKRALALVILAGLSGAAYGVNELTEKAYYATEPGYTYNSITHKDEKDVITVLNDGSKVMTVVSKDAILVKQPGIVVQAWNTVSNFVEDIFVKQKRAE